MCRRRAGEHTHRDRSTLSASGGSLGLVARCHDRLDGDGNIFETRALRFEPCERPRNIRRSLQPVSVGLELGGVSDGFTCGSVCNGSENQGARRGGSGDTDFQRGSCDADKIFGVCIERVGGQFAYGSVEDKLNVELVVTERTEAASVRSGVDMRMASTVIMIVAGMVMVVLVFGAT